MLIHKNVNNIKNWKNFYQDLTNLLKVWFYDLGKV